jgi:signal transduction histidine kinase/CheY-like chemotaxis protein
VQCRLHVADGSARWHLVRAIRAGHSGDETKWIGTLTDIEDEKRAEQFVWEHQKRESIGALAGGIAHDFNNLLCAIIGGVCYALEGLPSNDISKPLLEGALEAGERAARLTRELLAYAGKASCLKKAIDISEIVRSSIDALKERLPDNLEPALLLRRHLPPVTADPQQIEQIVTNLVLNAAEATVPGQRNRIAIRTGVEQITNPRTTSTGSVNPGVYVLIEVRDTGGGIDAAALPKIFDPFFSTKFPGRGLGLAAVDGIVRSLAGAIEVTSTAGGGSVFRILIPALVQEAELAGGELAQGSCSARTILVVDDEPVVRNMAKAVLEDAGYMVEVAAGGEQALGALRAAPEKFSLVLLDFAMPGLSGEATLDLIRQTHPELPVVVCSGYLVSDVQRMLAGRAVTGFLEKPFRTETLRDTVANFAKGL